MSGLQVERNRVFLFKRCSPFAYILVGRPKDAVPVIRGTSLHGESVVARQHTGSTSWFVWLRNMVLILRSTGPYSFMATSLPHLRSLSDSTVLRGFNLSLSKRHCQGPEQRRRPRWIVTGFVNRVWEARSTRAEEAIGTAVSETVFFAFSTGNPNIITLDHVEIGRKHGAI